MSSDSQDSEGEDLDIIRPTLIQELRNILDLYPDDGQILKELIQNAEDAGATVVKVLTDKRQFNQNIDSGTLKKHPHLKFFKGPALCVYNDAEFSTSDWKGIRMLHTSIKEKDPLKVGRFGLGFKSVFHLTDRLVIVSGDYIMYMDPFKGEDRYCNWRRIAGRKGKERQSILHSLGEVFGITEQIFQAGSGRFHGTLFWFPLRLSASDLSGTLYTDPNLESLLASFRVEAPSLLLFLNHVQRVEILTRDNTHDPQQTFSVGIAPACLRTIQNERERFVWDITLAGAGLPQNETFCITEVVLETHETCQKTSARWLVVNYHGGQSQMSPALLRLCTDGDLCYRPYVGVAVPLTNQDNFQSQLFCFLPLPLDTRSPTGLPVHVHGYFALEQNRRHLKWPPADQLMHSVTSFDPASQWNCLLVKELLPVVYKQALLRLKNVELCGNKPATFYKAWPDLSKVQDRWKPLLQPLYSSLTQQAVFFSHNLGARWIVLSRATLQLFSHQFTEEVNRSVVKVYTANNQPLVQLPQHIDSTLTKLGLRKGVPVMNATQVSQFIHSCLPRLQRQDKLNLLHYLSRHGAPLLLNQHLLPLADGVSFGMFRSAGTGKQSTFLCPRQLIELFPGLEWEFCDDSVPAHVREDLQHLAQSGRLSMEELHSSDSRIPGLLEKSLQARFGAGSPVVNAADPWLQHVWQFLASARDLTMFSHITLLPLPVDGNCVSLLPLKGRYVSSSASGMSAWSSAMSTVLSKLGLSSSSSVVSPLSSAMSAVLSKLGITVLHDLPSYVTSHNGVMGNFVNFPSPQGILEAIQSVNDNVSLQNKAVREFNATATADEKAALLQFVSSLGNSSGTIPALFHQLNLFKAAFTYQSVSVSQVSQIGPSSLPPISPPKSLLSCGPLERNAALSLGAREESLPQIAKTILDVMCSETSTYSEHETVQFMKYFLQTKVLMSEPTLQLMARGISFVTTECGTLQLPANLYDPLSPLLQDLFHSQRLMRFPCGEFADPEMLKKLKKLGLCSENELTSDDLIAAAKAVSDTWQRQDTESAMKSAEALFLYLNKYSDQVSSITLNAISTIQCLPCLQDGDKPAHYPKSLAIRSHPPLVRPADMYSYTLVAVIGSVAPVCRLDFSGKLAGQCVRQEAGLMDVLQHLRVVTTQFQQQDVSQYKMILNEIFHCLAHNGSDPHIITFLQSEKCILRETGETFSQPADFWIQRQNGDIDLKPYRFALPVEMQQMTDLLEQCGSSRSQTDDMLKTVLAEIQSKHMDPCISQSQCHTDLQLVQQILEVLKKSQVGKDENTLLPVMHEQTTVLRFKPAKECTVMPGMKHPNRLPDMGFEIHVVHPEIPANTALDLGACQMQERALTGLEGLDFEYEQHEDMTTRLHNLLKESYTDGFSVPKELIQNADDACASKVSFLLDERENTDCRTNLFADAMSSLQGPAIWAYNDAMFSSSDFQNVIRLGAGTKKEDTSKVGRFGLGFNAVYNLTDVPCFISGHILAMFDPQVRYLGKGAGLKLDFTKPINKALLSSMPEQFQPFQNVFGCTLKGPDVNYKGTLFRFPLRTAEQAIDNKLKSESYSELKRRDFLKMLLEKAGSLLLFTQNVKEIEVFYIPRDCTDVTTRTCLLTVRKSCVAQVVSQPQVGMNNKTVLQFMKDNWLKHKDIKIQQKLDIEITVTAEANDVCRVEKSHSSTQWQVAWASGTGKSARMALEMRHEGLVPLAAAAISVSDSGLIPLRDSPTGFYSTGHLFCFLPLPENLELSQIILPVHVNGTFALTSSRRGLIIQTEDDLDSGGSSWNTALYSDAVCRAYLLLLQQISREAAADSDFSRFFDLWPRAGVPCLVNSFYLHLQTDGNTVLPVPGHHTWTSFNDAFFLQSHFRDSDCGQIAWNALQRFWKGPGYLVDVPSDICKLMNDKGSPGAFTQKVITELAFYRDVFFPNLLSEWWRPEERDHLIHHAVMKNNEEINQLIRDHACIPCQGGRVLRKPQELVSPKGLVANLFLTSEQRFPQMATLESAEAACGELAESRVDFCCERTLQWLSRLGMVTNVLPWDMVLDRARSVGRLSAEKNVEESLHRACHLIEYLSVSTDGPFSLALENCPNDLKQSLSQTAFLPVLRKPSDWPFPWAGDEAADCSFLAPPADLCLETMKNLVACKRKLLDVKVLKPGETFPVLGAHTRKVLRLLGVTVAEDHFNMNLFESVLDQLIIIADLHNTCPQDKEQISQAISNNVYAYLNNCVKRSEDNTGHSVLKSQVPEPGASIMEIVRSKLTDRSIIWTGSCFVQPSKVAFHCPYNCAPYLLQLGANDHMYRDFFKAAGVRERFACSNVLLVLETVYQENRGKQLADDTVDLVSQIAQLLASIARTPSSEQLDTSRVFLPDIEGFMEQAGSLCVDDCPRLTEINCMRFVNEKIPVDTARLLGVNTKQRQHFSLITRPISVKPFGQSEKLTTRIRRLLQGYTLDSSLWKELLQNADDAEATEAKFIMDFRSLPTETVPEKWESLQGPALCFYNNRSFTAEDMQGIQNLGIGSKGQDELKIGQFGVGFSAVFHITDIPSFWTKVDDAQDVICVLDPNCQYILDAEPGKPGIEFTDIQEVRHNYPDFFSGYLDDVIDKTQSGTLFRFPLRTEKMAEMSEIKKETVTQTDITKLLEEFREEISSCLLFLGSLKTVGIYSVHDDGTLNKEFEVNKTVDESSCQPLRDFKDSLQQACLKMKEVSASVKNMPVFECAILSKIVDSGGDIVDWLTIHRAGFAEGVHLSEELEQEWGKENFRMLPRGGVAVKLKAQRPNDRGQNSQKYQAFCMLPLPVYTGLPVHVNGHFALDHETRRNLWGSGTSKDVRFEWNEAIAFQVVVPAYITALKLTKSKLFPDNGQNFSESVMTSALKQYHDLFPQPCGDTFWVNMVHQIYRVIAEKELPLFPVICTETQQVEWLPAVRNKGFPGYFNTLDDMYSSQAKEQERNRQVILTTGISASSRRTTEASPSETAKEMQSLLKRLNMKILEAPLQIYKNFQESGVQQVQVVTADSVLEFLRSSGQRIATGCNIHSLPKPVTDTPLESASNVQKIVEFVRKSANFLSQLDGLPLCLRQSDTLHVFSASAPSSAPIISKYYFLLPGSAEEFLHHCIIKFFTNLNETKGVLQTFSVPMFASRLHKSLTEPCLKAGKPCVFEINRLPSVPCGKTWLRELWKFFEKELKKQIQQEETSEDSAPASHGHMFGSKDAVKNVRKRAEEMLCCLSEWCLIPVQKKEGTQDKEMMYPMKDLHKVVYLSSVPDQTNACLWEVLKKLPLPFLNTLQLPALSCLNNLVASISHPRALLHALASCANRLEATHEDGCEILDYFSKTLNSLKESSADVVQLKKELRSLPVFPAIGEGLVSLSEPITVLCVNASIPGDGLRQWACHDHVLLRILRSKHVPRMLQEFLDFKHVNKYHFYLHYLLPTLEVLPHDAILRHMTFLRDKIDWDKPDEHQELILQLKRTAFINVHGTLHRAEEFVSPHEPVFKTMCSLDQFPPEPYSKPEWKQYMILAGMVSEVTPARFLRFIHTVALQGRQGITEDVVKKSKTLVKHLFHRKDLTQTNLLSEVKDVQFLVPLDWKHIPNSQQLEKIAQPFNPARLISFSESDLEHHLYLVWSSSWILAGYAYPWKYIHDKSVSQVLSLLGLHKTPPKNKVFQHLMNITQSLSGENGLQIFASLKQYEQLLINIMDSIYQYLEGNISNCDIPHLKEVPLICDIEGKLMLKPVSVVIDRPKEIIRGHVEKAPLTFGRYFELFKKLGTSQSVTANHYARFLAWLKTQSRETALHVEELKLVKSALEGLFDCLKEGSQEQNEIAVSALYLPTEEKCLQRSTEIVYKDGAFGPRFQDSPENMHFFIGFQKLDMKVAIPLETITLLPRQHQMTRLSHIVKEIIPDTVLRTATEGIQSRQLMAALEHEFTKVAIVRLVCHECRKSECTFTAESAQEVCSKLSKVYVKQISGLKTVLTLHGQEIPGSESLPQSSFIDKIEGTSRQAVVFIDVENFGMMFGTNQFLRSVAYAINYVLGINLEKFYLTDILQNPWDAENILDRAAIDECDFSVTTGESVFPPAGRNVLEYEQCYLDNSFYHFTPGEHVGYELYDPDVANPEEGFPDPEYRYAIIIEEVCRNGAENVPLLAQRYRIYLGPDHGEAEVSVTRLYKFFRKEATNQRAESTSTDIVKHRGQAGARENRSSPDMKTVFKEIKATLSEAWQQFEEESDRRRVMKRLLLKWHPDRNHGNEEFCTRVTQKIFHYIDLLNEGKTLPSDDEDEENFSSHRTDSMFNSSFYANMSSRARMYRDYYESGPRFSAGESASSSGSFGQQYRGNPQRGEAQRWFRQAKADVTAAQAARGSCDRGHNWICYQCHQAVEKAMKAVIYFRDADRMFMQSHALTQLASIITDSDIMQMAQQLESRLGPHTRMRYPDVQVFPRIPADVYSEEDARWACDIAERVLQRVQSLIEV